MGGRGKERNKTDRYRYREREKERETRNGILGDEKPRKWSIRVINSEFWRERERESVARGGIKRTRHKSRAFVLI